MARKRLTAFAFVLGVTLGGLSGWTYQYVRYRDD